MDTLGKLEDPTSAATDKNYKKLATFFFNQDGSLIAKFYLKEILWAGCFLTVLVGTSVNVYFILDAIY